MGVYIPSMEMPERCETCDLICDDDSGLEVCCCTGEIVDREEQARPRWCPLRPLPEKHGRLIDAKVLDVAFTALRFNDDGTLRHWDDRKNWCLHGGEVESLIADAPTIVEAEGE